MKRVLGAVAVILCSGFIIIGIVISNRSKPQATQTTPKLTTSFQDSGTQLKLDYSSSLQAVQLTDTDKKDKYVLKLENKPINEATPLLVRITYEDGLRAVVALTKSELIPMLMSNAESSAKKIFKSLTIESSRQFEVAGHKAGEVIFTYRGQTNQQVKRRLVMIARDDNLVLYLAAESETTEYTRLNTSYFEPLIQSIRF